MVQNAVPSQLVLRARSNADVARWDSSGRSRRRWTQSSPWLACHPADIRPKENNGGKKRERRWTSADVQTACLETTSLKKAMNFWNSWRLGTSIVSYQLLAMPTGTSVSPLARPS